MGRRGMVAASQPLAAEVGLQALRAGGHAVDAAVATASALAVVEPTGTGLGGDCFALVYDARSRVVQALDGSGRSPAALTAELLRRRGHATMPVRGALAVTVPGAVDAWAELLAVHGRTTLAEALAPAAALARDGFPASELVAAAWRRSEALLAASPEGLAHLLPQGRAPRPGEVVRMPALAGALAAVAEGGPDAFYRGPIAEDLVAVVQRAGGVLDAGDLAAHRSAWQAPARAAIGDAWLWECGLPTQGVVALEAAAILEDHEACRAPRGSAEALHGMIEAVRLGFADAAAHVGDPARAPMTAESLLAPERIRAARARLRPDRALERPVAALPPVGGTVYLAVVDADGNACSLIGSNYMGFGSGLVGAASGIPLQNRGAGFVLEDGHPNAVGPRRQPFHTIIPALLTRRADDSLLAVLGVMGGHMQPQGHLQVAANLLWWGLDPQRALDAPRFQVTPDDRLALEPAIPHDVRLELARLGHDLVAPHDAPDAGSFGGGQVVAVTEEGVRVGGSDPRKDGQAVAQV